MYTGRQGTNVQGLAIRNQKNVKYSYQQQINEKNNIARRLKQCNEQKEKKVFNLCNYKQRRSDPLDQCRVKDVTQRSNEQKKNNFVFGRPCMYCTENNSLLAFTFFKHKCYHTQLSGAVLNNLLLQYFLIMDYLSK